MIKLWLTKLFTPGISSFILLKYGRAPTDMGLRFYEWLETLPPQVIADVHNHLHSAGVVVIAPPTSRLLSVNLIQIAAYITGRERVINTVYKCLTKYEL